MAFYPLPSARRSCPAWLFLCRTAGHLAGALCSQATAQQGCKALVRPHSPAPGKGSHILLSFLLSVRAGGSLIFHPAPIWRGILLQKGPSMTNPRYANGALRRKHRARLKAMGAPCGICGGRLGPIHYDEPSDAAHPLSFVVDEIRPVARWREFGYPSPRAAAEDWDNLQAAHYWCNAQKGCKLSPAKPNSAQHTRTQRPPADGSW